MRPRSVDSGQAMIVMRLMCMRVLPSAFVIRTVIGAAVRDLLLMYAAAAGDSRARAVWISPVRTCSLIVNRLTFAMCTSRLSEPVKCVVTAKAIRRSCRRGVVGSHVASGALVGEDVWATAGTTKQGIAAVAAVAMDTSNLEVRDMQQER